MRIAAAGGGVDPQPPKNRLVVMIAVIDSMAGQIRQFVARRLRMLHFLHHGVSCLGKRILGRETLGFPLLPEPLVPHPLLENAQPVTLVAAFHPVPEALDGGPRRPEKHGAEQFVHG